jgi:hypothetical protein
MNAGHDQKMGQDQQMDQWVRIERSWLVASLAKASLCGEDFIGVYVGSFFVRWER